MAKYLVEVVRKTVYRIPVDAADEAAAKDAAMELGGERGQPEHDSWTYSSEVLKELAENEED